MTKTYVEITKSEHNHGGEGWEFGNCLWSPTVNRSGADRYSLMREPMPGDRVIHFYRDVRDGQLNTWIAGESAVESPVREVSDSPPHPGDWAGMKSYYRIELENYRDFSNQVALPTLLNGYGDEILDDLLSNKHRFYPFTTHGPGQIRTVQGIYLARCSGTLETIIERALTLEDAAHHVQYQEDTHAVFAEAKRLAREKYFFARNPSLTRAAKEVHGCACQVCGISFCDLYGELGRDFIEGHHLDPLSERPEREWSDTLTTSIEKIAVLCSNCHSMIHRRKPALSVEELKNAMAEAQARSE